MAAPRPAACWAPGPARTRRASRPPVPPEGPSRAGATPPAPAHRYHRRCAPPMRPACPHGGACALPPPRAGVAPPAGRVPLARLRRPCTALAAPRVRLRA
eukprot:379722-Pleurochrysis_carterae.AAC.1